MDNNIIPNKSGGQQEEGKMEKKQQQTKKGPKGGVGGKSRGAKVVGKRGGGKTKMAKKVMRSARAGLYFPVSRVHRQFKRKTVAKGRVSGTAAVYTTAILEYLAAEILELAGNAAKSFNLKRVTPRHLYLAVRGDEELDTLIRGTIAGGGVIPHIHRMLMIKPGETSLPRAMAAEQNMMAMVCMPSTSKAEGIVVTNAMVAQQAQAKGKGPPAVATDEHDYASQATAQEADRDSMLSERDSSVDVREL